MNIAVVGSGIAGTTVAWQLADQGHSVTLFEQAGKCGPIGAGILLQPSGQAVLARLGVLDEVTLKTAKISNLLAQHRSGRTLVHLPYAKVSGCSATIGSPLRVASAEKDTQMEGLERMLA
ncbi:hypothetical protein Enr13x_09740 [Stieleria neptunia]|uniref:Uncharacterized protein n=1 Tax=Stieleria neptunia TaxID=2527979 RepID=A0A518HJV3_9BACT|nr:FAD-dependent oxidoreductase [Stieleria neptunia]QDV41136.1 hypothetical protein Enr13x_09740 [Stieleria neptunia]